MRTNFSTDLIVGEVVTYQISAYLTLFFLYSAVVAYMVG